MKLSIIIVSYNVRCLLEKCLDSVIKAAENISAEIIIVDNHSSDDTVAILKKKYPQLTLIENLSNKGFSVANNQGIKIAKGEFILLLNPDTVIETDTFTKCIDFMNIHPEAGALGVKMQDGNGNFLPESKRGLPTPSAAFFKFSGLSKLFPKSELFTQYHLSYLSPDKTHQVPILAGAFMFVRKIVLDNIGLLDEQFFMYGEDIDLSYRIIQAGYSNYYFPETKIVHYKGQSTDKNTPTYVINFYRAMLIFNKKHFPPNKGPVSYSFITIAIYLMIGMAFLKIFLNRFST